MPPATSARGDMAQFLLGWTVQATFLSVSFRRGPALSTPHSAASLLIVRFAATGSNGQLEIAHGSGRSGSRCWGRFNGEQCGQAIATEDGHASIVQLRGIPQPITAKDPFTADSAANAMGNSRPAGARSGNHPTAVAWVSAHAKLYGRTSMLNPLVLCAAAQNTPGSCISTAEGQGTTKRIADVASTGTDAVGAIWPSAARTFMQTATQASRALTSATVAAASRDHKMQSYGRGSRWAFLRGQRRSKRRHNLQRLCLARQY